jgi:hypothetical protein
VSHLILASRTNITTILEFNTRSRKIKFDPYTKIGILDILTKLYIIYAYILIAKPNKGKTKRELIEPGPVASAGPSI